MFKEILQFKKIITYHRKDLVTEKNKIKPTSVFTIGEFAINKKGLFYLLDKNTVEYYFYFDLNDDMPAQVLKAGILDIDKNYILFLSIPLNKIEEFDIFYMYNYADYLKSDNIGIMFTFF